MGSIKDVITKNLLVLLKNFVPTGTVADLKAKLIQELEARAARTGNKIDDNVVVLMKSKEADALIHVILCCLGKAVVDAAKSTETEIDDAAADILIRALGISLEDCEEGETTGGDEASEGEASEDEVQG